MDNLVTGTYQNGAKALDSFLNFKPLLDSLGQILDDFRPATYLIAFILLVVSTMHGFMQADSRRFFHNLVHSIILVALVCQAATVVQWVDDAAKAFAALPHARTINVGGQKVSFKSGESPLIQEIQTELASKAEQKGDAGKKDGGFNALDPRSWVSAARAVVFQILFGLYLLVLLLAKMIMLLMIFVQKIVVIGFKLYLPIGIAEYSIRALKGKATNFFLTFIGVLCWPIGWSIVNSVTLAILNLVPAPADFDLPSLIWANVMVVPVLIWVFVGHVLAPVYVQKVVIHGGGVIQGFVGATFSAVGMASASLTSAGLQGFARFGDGKGSEWGRGASGGYAKPVRSSLTKADSQPILADACGSAEKSAQKFGGKRGAQSEENAATLPLDFAAGVVGRTGVVAGLLGHAVVQGSGGGTRLEGETLAALAPLGTYGPGIRRRTSRTNRSSVRAREYIDADDNLGVDG